MLIFTLSGCIAETSNGITFDFQDKSITVEVGSSVTLEPIIIGFSGNDITYTSSDDPFDPCINVTQSGVITAIKVGSTSIIAKLNGAAGVATVTIDVTVIPETEDPIIEDPIVDDPVIPLTVTITGGSQSNNIISATVGDVIQLGIYANKSYTETPVWTSSITSTGYVSSSGLFAALAVGTTRIDLTVGDASDYVFITVGTQNQDPVVVTPQITSILIAGQMALTVGNDTSLTITADQDIPFTVNWTSSNNSIATVDGSGKVTAISTGVVNVTATLSTNTSITDTWTMVVQESEPIITITNISLSGDSNLLVGNKTLFTVTFTPSGQTGNVTWSSSNNSIASVATSGLITGVGAGTATITATLTSNPSISATKTIVVTSKPTSVTVSGATSIDVGSTTSLTATVLPTDTIKTVTWISNNTSVATVSSTGVVTALAPGLASIIVTSTIDTNIFGRIDIVVNAVLTPTLSLSISNSSINVGATTQITAVVTNTTNTGVTYTSSNTGIATVSSSGLVTGIAAGSAIITGRLVVDNTVTSTVSVTVLAVNPIPTVSVSPTSTSVNVGATIQLTASTTNTTVTWSSSNTSVATVSSSGLVTGVSAGSATITATSVVNTSVKATCALTVNSVPTGTLNLVQSPSGTIAIGASGYQITLTNSSGTSVSRLECTFTSSNSSIATVSIYGTISALANGTTTITATHPTYGSGTILLTVGTGGGTTPPVGSLSVTADPSASIPVGATGYQLYVRDSSDTSLSRLECTFTSSNSSVATVSTYGGISALSAGSVIISVTHPTGGSGSISLTITSSGTDPFDRIITFGTNPTYSSNATLEMTNPFYWLRIAQTNGVNIDATLLTTSEIAAQNTIMINQGNMRLVSASTLAGKTTVTSGEVDSLRSTFGYSLPTGWVLQSTVQHAVVTSFSQMKNYPTTSTTKTYMETGLEVGEGVAIYGKYSSGSWLLVRSQNYFGWIPASTVGTCTGTQMATFANPSSFAVVTAERIKTTQVSGLPTMLRMGTKLPLVSSNSTSATVKVPTRNSDGTLNTTGVNVSIPIDNNEYIHVGYLPYTTKNVVKQMFKMLGQVYGWGDLGSDRDCSSTIWAAYKCSGFLLARNTTQQELISTSTYTRVYPSSNIGTNYSTYLPNVRMGAIMLMSGHVVMYLGKVGTRYYIIHQYGSLYCQVTDTKGYSFYNTKTFIKS